MRLGELIQRLIEIQTEQGSDVWTMIAPGFGRPEVRPVTDIGVLFPKSSGTLVVIK